MSRDYEIQLEKRITDLETSVATWRSRANDSDDKLVQIQIRNNRLVSALQTIQHTGFVGDTWVDIATEALK